MDYDDLIIGSGAGGCAAAYRLAQAGRRVLMLEKGHRLPDDGSTLDPRIVMHEGRFASKEVWRDAGGARFVPEEHFNLGGKTRWYGAALLRMSHEEFAGDAGNALLPWPFAYETLAPYYEQAEALLKLHVFPAEHDLQRIAAGLSRSGWTSQPLPLGLLPEIERNIEAATHFDGYAVPGGLKSDAQYRLLAPLAGLTNFTVLEDSEVVALLPSADGPHWLRGVRCADGRELTAARILLAAGALHSPRLLQRYLHANHLPAKAQVGGQFKRHLLTAVVSFAAFPKTDVLRKTLLFTHPRYKRSSVQPLGGWIDHEIVRSTLPAWLPRFIVEFFAKRVYGFFLQTEEGSDLDNRITEADDGIPSLDYAAARLPQFSEHRRFVKGFMWALLRAGWMPFSSAVPLSGTAHACGTLVTGTAAASSVVDAQGRVHELENLYVVDGSVLPRIGRLNPALTIYAWALRVADGLLQKNDRVVE